MSAGEPRVVTRRELLRRREEEWGKRLLPGSLVAEFTKAAAVHTEQALGALGHLFAKANGGDRYVLLRRYPAVQVLATSQVATEHYDHGTFWPALCRLAGLPNDGQQIQKEWGTAFIDNLRTLDLPTFEDASDSGARFVGRILMHSGVPTYCLGDYFRVVAERRRAVPGIDASQFVEWAVDRARQDRLYNVDKPVQRFLRYGGEFALDVTDRVFELLDIVSTGGSGDEVPLPPRFAEAARWLRDQGGIETVTQVVRGRQAAAQPHLHLDPYGRGPVLRLPSVGDTADGTVTWVVTMDGHEERVTSTALWPGFHEPAPQVDVPIARPVRAAVAALPGHESLAYTLPVVDDNDPLLAFEEDGRALRTTVPFPGAPVWLLLPGSIDDLRSQGELTVLAPGVLPPGWSGWSLVLVDLASVSSVQVGGGSPHVVRSGAEARIVMPQPVPTVRSLDGEPIFAEPPLVALPEDVDAEWSASVQDDQGNVLVRRTLRHSDDVVELWSQLTRPLSGRFTLKVRGPWGRGANRRFTIIEGLDVEATPRWRRMTGRGLVPASVRVHVPEGFTAGPSQMHLDSRTVTRPLIVDCGPVSMRLSVEVPHMSVSHVCDDHVSAPSVTSLRLFTEDLLDDPGSIVLDVGADAEPVLHVLTPDGGPQLVRSKGGARGQAYRFDLREVTDTLAASRSLRISLDPDAALVIGTVRPRQLFTEVRMEGARLIFDDCANIEGLSALCYATMAPWCPAVAVPVEDGQADLPPSLVDVGSLLVAVRIDDPWVPVPVPPWPGARSSRFVEGAGTPLDGDATELALSRLLAGDEDLPESFAADSRAWDTLDRLWALHLADRFGEVRARLSQAIQARPQNALLELLASSATVDRMPFLLIRSGLAWTPVEEPRHEEATVAWSRRSAMVLALLGAWDLDDEDGFDAVVAVCGDDVTQVVTGTDPSAAAGRFDEVIDRLAKMPQDVRESIMASAAFVPRGLLHQDSRALAAKQLLDRRDDDDLRWLRWKVQGLLHDLEGTLRSVEFEAGLAAVRARRHPTADHGWRVMPAWSIGMAIVARLAAHGIVAGDQLTPDSARAWEDLAQVAPDLVTIDLILAELLVRAHHLQSPGALVMPQLDAISTAADITGTYRRYLQTLLAVRDPTLDAALRKAISQTPLLDKGPYLEATPPYRAGASCDQLVAEGVLHPEFPALGSAALPLDRPLYVHQEQAIRKVAAGRNVVVATGTGSGKTESFLLPILDSLVAEAGGRRTRSGRPRPAPLPDERSRQRPDEAAAGAPGGLPGHHLRALHGRDAQRREGGSGRGSAS